MKFVTDYKELGGNEEISLLDHLSKEPIENKEKILKYLRSGKNDGVRCSSIYDYVKDDTTFKSTYLFTDGEYKWDSEEIYHFEEYNMKLNEEFIQKVLKHPSK